MSNKPNKRSQKLRSNQGMNGNQSKSKDYATVLSLVNRLSSIEPSLFRRICTAVTVTTNGSGVIPVTLLCNTATVTGYSDFSSVANLYQQYRVHAFKVAFFPVIRVNTTAVTPPPYCAVAPFRAGLVPSGIAVLQASPDCLHISGYDKGVATVSFVGDNDAHLWTPINAAVPATEDYGLYICGSSLTATASTNVWYAFVEAVIEFRTTG